MKKYCTCSITSLDIMYDTLSMGNASICMHTVFTVTSQGPAHVYIITINLFTKSLVTAEANQRIKNCFQKCCHEFIRNNLISLLDCGINIRLVGGEKSGEKLLVHLPNLMQLSSA